MDKEKHLEVSSLGGKKRSENYHNQSYEQAKKNTSASYEKLEDILTNIEVLDEL